MTFLQKAAVAAIFIASAIMTSASPTMAQDAEEPSLYTRLGGIYSIATVVDDFIERLLVNETLNANPAIYAARASVPKAGLKYRVTTLVGQVTGGPEMYHLNYAVLSGNRDATR